MEFRYVDARLQNGRGPGWVAICGLAVGALMAACPARGQAGKPDETGKSMQENDGVLWSYMGFVSDSDGYKARYQAWLEARGPVVFAASGIQAVALDRETGRPLWTQTVERLQGTPPVLAGDLLLVPEWRGLRALRTASGTTAWQVRTAEPPWAGPVVSAGRVLFATSGEFEVEFKDGSGVPGQVFARSLADGKELWTIRANGWPVNSLEVDGRLVFCVSEPDSLRALDAVTGTLRWKVVSRRGCSAAGLYRIGDRVLFDVCVCLLAVDAETGKVRWQREEADLVGLDASAGLVYVRGSNGALAALDVRNGTERWTWQAHAGSGPGEWLDGFDAERIYTARGNALFALDRASGRVLWQAAVRDDRITHLFGPTGRLVAVGSSTLTSFQDATGRELWTRQGLDRPAILGEEDGVLFVTNGPAVLGLKASDGSEEMRVVLPARPVAASVGFQAGRIFLFDGAGTLHALRIVRR